ncbi:MAG: hypothetical protein RLZZ200_2882 [Pseudomonadota bacterium]
MTGSPIYLDHAATTPVDPRVASLVSRLLAAPPGNPGSSHAQGRRAAALVEVARAQVAALVGASPDQVVFTSGATEADNLAILGHMRGLPVSRRTGAEVITLATEHKAVLTPVRKLAREGFASTVLLPGPNGRLHPGQLEAAMTPATALVSVLHVNNETGVVQDIAAIAALCTSRGIALHVDAAQSAAWLPLDGTGIDYLSLSAHKLGGPPGVGALVVSPRRRGTLEPLQVGGGQERGLRAGTVPVPLVAGFGLACELVRQDRDSAALRVAALRDRLQASLEAAPGVLFNGDRDHRSPAILNLSFEDVEGEALVGGLPSVAVSTGSACDSATGEPSFVLRALGRDTQLAQASLRFSLGRGTTESEIDQAAAAVRATLAQLRALSPGLPPPVADWRDAGDDIRIGEAGAARLGTWVRMLLCVREGRIAEARFQAYGCPHVLAACVQVVAALRGQPADAPRPGTPEAWRGAVDAPIEKLGRFLIIEDALRNTIPTWPST